MIQLKRGSTNNWRSLTRPLAAGQPGYDKKKHKIKIGDGERLWNALPYASGLSEEDILYPELLAKARFLLDPEDKTLITYGTDGPDETTVGKLYLQYYDTEPETDRVVNFGTSGIWTYRQWYSGLAECWCRTSVTTTVNEAFDSKALYHSALSAGSFSYPFSFNSVPSETATLLSQSGVAWLAGKAANTESVSGEYIIISPDSLTSSSFEIAIHAKGFWR